MRTFVILLLNFFLIFQGLSQSKETPSPIIFIYDASGSMWGQMQGKTKMEIASGVLAASINDLPANQKIGLVAYGHRKKSDCEDVEFLVDISTGSKAKINDALKAIKPLGMTPLAYSATQVINQLRTLKTKATIILVTDGIESCKGNICEVIQAAKKEGIDFRLHIIGFGLQAEETETLKCAAKAGDGQYYDAADASGLGVVLNEATTKTIDKPKSNFSVYALKNKIAIDAYIKAYDVTSKREPISVRTYRDTAFIYLPPGNYNLEAKPLEGSDVNMITVSGVKSYEDKSVHQDISFDGGKLGITTTNNGENWDCMVKMIDKTGKVAASIRTYQAPREIEVNPGTYKITIQPLVIEGIENYTEIEAVTIKAAEMTSISHDFKTGKAYIEGKVDGKFIDCLVTIDELKTRKNVATGRTYDRGKEFLLNPGTYSVKVVPLGKFNDRKPQIITIEVTKGKTTSKSVIL